MPSKYPWLQQYLMINNLLILLRILCTSSLFSLAKFSLTLDSLIMHLSLDFLKKSSLLIVHCASCMCGLIWTIYSYDIFKYYFCLFFFPSELPKVGTLNGIQKVFAVLFILLLFPPCSLNWIISTDLSLNSWILPSACSNLLDSSGEFSYQLLYFFPKHIAGKKEL